MITFDNRSKKIEKIIRQKNINMSDFFSYSLLRQYYINIVTCSIQTAANHALSNLNSLSKENIIIFFGNNYISNNRHYIKYIITDAPENLIIRYLNLIEYS